ncbi:MAG: zf-HC2 domain-containing protein, partial [Prevotella sp.]|nr:zf-HC2 domain-containing protein [Prevotella sp.]
MDCKEFRNIVADLFDKDVDPQIKTECEKHISQCADCRAYYEDL